MSADDFATLTDPFRRELLAHCYRMLGSYHDAEDLVQETYVRAWRGFGGFEGRSSIRTWLYRIATRVCLTALDSRARRVLPSGLAGPSEDPAGPLPAHRADVAWLEPLPDRALAADDPADVVQRRETLRLAFVSALQLLPARQRAALVLRDVIGWPASDVAEVLDLSVAAVNSALQRARAHLAQAHLSPEEVTVPVDVDTDLVDQFVTAFEAADMDELRAILREEVRLEMPPIASWFAGLDDVITFFTARLRPGQAQWRIVPTRANGCPAAATYRRDDYGILHAHSIQVLELCDGRVARIYAFLDPAVFAAFELPAVLAE